MSRIGVDYTKNINEVVSKVIFAIKLRVFFILDEKHVKKYFEPFIFLSLLLIQLR